MEDVPSEGLVVCPRAELEGYKLPFESIIVLPIKSMYVTPAFKAVTDDVPVEDDVTPKTAVEGVSETAAVIDEGNGLDAGKALDAGFGGALTIALAFYEEFLLEANKTL